MSINLIVAMNHNLVIGINNSLPWHLPDDLQYFKRVTKDSVVIMGRKTYESIGKPLPQRDNIVLTRDTHYQAAGCIILHTLPQAIAEANNKNKPVFIIGGADLYAQALPLCQTLYITVVDNHDEGDIFFPTSLPELLQQGWHIAHKEAHAQDNRHHCKFTWYELKQTTK
tara:strand:- start:936 stop:1442 length:507 start_codon:yes stop_codon:yes gene_type:complete